MNTCVLVTGGSGFIGTWVLCELLNYGTRTVVSDTRKMPARGARVLGDRSRDVAWADASLLSCDELQNVIEQHQVTHLIHHAALLTPACQQDPWLGCQVNVMGSTGVTLELHPLPFDRMSSMDRNGRSA